MSMSHNEEMINRLQPFMRKSKIYEEIFETEGTQYATRDDAVADLQLQLNVDTATWALPIYETELGIAVDPSKSYSERRAVIKSKMRGVGQVDAALIKLVVDSWTNGDVNVSFADSTITITFTSVIGIPENISDVEIAIEEIKAAHLAVLYVYLYNTYGVLSAFTHGELSAYTHEDLSSSALS